MLIAPGIPSWLLEDGCTAAKVASNITHRVSDTWKRWDLLESFLRASCASGSSAAQRGCEEAWSWLWVCSVPTPTHADDECMVLAEMFQQLLPDGWDVGAL